MAVGVVQAHPPPPGGRSGRDYRRGERTALHSGSSSHYSLLQFACSYSLLLVSRPLRTGALLPSGCDASSPLLRKSVQFPEDSAAEKSAANYWFLSNVANARNACRKFSTGMIGKSPACRRASAAFSGCVGAPLPCTWRALTSFAPSSTPRLSPVRGRGSWRCTGP